MTHTEPHAERRGDGGTVLNLRNLSVTYGSGHRNVRAVQSLNLSVEASQTVAIVGESGSGKSTVVNAILGILPAEAQVTGQVEIAGKELSGSDERQWLETRRQDIGYIPQDPQTSLDPTMKIGAQLTEIVRLKEQLAGDDAQSRVLALLDDAGIDDALLRCSQYPHELSGGLKQRVLIAAAMAGSPRLIVADEPTSALDVTVQRLILDALEHLVHQRGISLILVTHDLAVASDRAQRIVVMHDGQIVETAGTEAILHHSTNAYTRRLVESAPAFELARANEHTPTSGANAVQPNAAGENGPAEHCETAELAVEWKGTSKVFYLRNSAASHGGRFTALDNVSLSAHKGSTLAVVGESGSGKSTLLRIALGLIKPTGGTVLVNGLDVVSTKGRRLRRARRDFQLVQQNPYASLDNKLSIFNVIAEPLNALHEGDREQRRQRVYGLLDRVALPKSVLWAHASELSGGQCQRVAIARALAIRPKTLFLDEPVSALDATVQAQIMDLLTELQQDLHLSYVFVSHDLAVVAMLAHRIAVLNRGVVVEAGTADEILNHATNPYTQRLIDSVPGRSR